MPPHTANVATTSVDTQHAQAQAPCEIEEMCEEVVYTDDDGPKRMISRVLKLINS